MSHIHSFPAISDHHATRLILGTMPGKASLAAAQYYAHPRNLFWVILDTLKLVDAQADYSQRCQQLVEQKIALWDVLKLCTRSSSLDSDIVTSSMVANDLRRFLQEHPNISKIFFNGAKAEQIYRRQLRAQLSADYPHIITMRLPSTSPANAGIARDAKISAWQALVQD